MERTDRNKPLYIGFAEFSRPQREESELLEYLCKKEAELNNCAEEGDKEKKAKYLGIRKKNSQFEACHFVGMRWLEEGKCFLTVKPKIINLDYISMYLECLESKEIIDHLDNTFDLYPEEQFIPIKKDEWPKISPLVVITFLKKLFDLTKRHIRLNYITITENLRSRIKGKIRVPDTIKRNHSKFKIESTVCAFQLFSIDCLENRILKLALEKSLRYLTHKKLLKSPIDIWLNYCRVVFEKVSLVPITYQDFQKVHYI
jgi:5-methylcytosine-specific restriction enzyme subunit McrC